MNTQKYKTGNLGLLKEADRSLYEREVDGEIQYDTVSRSSIDFSRTHLNYNLCGHEDYSPAQVREIHERLRGKRMSARDNAFGGTVVTLPKALKNEAPEVQQKFFKSAKKGLMSLYGLTEDDLISCWVHMDETTPHMHFYFIPVYHPEMHLDKEGTPKGKETVSWEKVITKTVYQVQHERLQQIISKDMEMDVQLLTGGSLGFDVQQLTPDQKKALMEIDSLKEKRSELYGREAELSQKLEQIEKDKAYYKEKDPEKYREVYKQGYEIQLEIKSIPAKKKKITEQIREKEEDLIGTKPSAAQETILQLCIQRERAEDEVAKQKAVYEAQISSLRAFFDRLCGDLMARFVHAYTAISQIMHAFHEHQRPERVKELGDRSTPHVEAAERLRESISKRLEELDQDGQLGCADKDIVLERYMNEYEDEVEALEAIEAEFGEEEDPEIEM